MNNENNRRSINNSQTKTKQSANRDWSVPSSAYRWLVVAVNARKHFLYNVGTAGAKTRTHQGIPLRIKIHNKQKKNSTNKRERSLNRARALRLHLLCAAWHLSREHLKLPGHFRCFITILPNDFLFDGMTMVSHFSYVTFEVLH